MVTLCLYNEKSSGSCSGCGEWVIASLVRTISSKVFLGVARHLSFQVIFSRSKGRSDRMKLPEQSLDFDLFTV